MTRKGAEAQILGLAFAVVIEAPIRWSKYCTTTYVRRDLVKRMRLAFEAAGYDWQKAALELRRARKAASAARAAAQVRKC